MAAETLTYIEKSPTPSKIKILPDFEMKHQSVLDSCRKDSLECGTFNYEKNADLMYI